MCFQTFGCSIFRIWNLLCDRIDYINDFSMTEFQGELIKVCSMKSLNLRNRSLQFKRIDCTIVTWLLESQNVKISRDLKLCRSKHKIIYSILLIKCKNLLSNVDWLNNNPNVAVKSVKPFSKCCGESVLQTLYIEKNLNGIILSLN